MRPKPVIVLAGVLLLLASNTSPAAAGNWTGATSSTGCKSANRADNRSHYFWYVDLVGHNEVATNYARTNAVDPTYANTYYDSAHGTHTDVIVRDQDYFTYCGYDGDSGTIGSGVVGLATCDRLSGAKCDQFTVRYDLSFSTPASWNQNFWLACHEIGHTLGLEHLSRDDSCMRPSDMTYRTYSVTGDHNENDSRHIGSL